MLKSISIKNFTLLRNETLQFSKGLNVYIGENGYGKSHMIKLPYAVFSSLVSDAFNVNDSAPTKTFLQGRIAKKLLGVFKPDALGRLTKRKQGREKTEVSLYFNDISREISFSFSTNSKTEVEVSTFPSKWFDNQPVFLPTRELLTIFPGFVSLYNNYHLEFEETWYDTCLLLGAPVSKGAREGHIKKMLLPIEDAIGGSVVLNAAGRFYLKIPGIGSMEIPLVAEGLRKLAMLARLISTGTLQGNSVLFWDEPEANLNPKLQKVVAKVIAELSLQGLQIHLATHSLFLLREIEILQNSKEFKNLETKYFGLYKKDEEIIVEQGDCLEDVKIITSLDEELIQSDRFMEISDEY